MRESLYFDHHTATPNLEELVEKGSRFSREYWASPSSYHFLGQQQLYPYERAFKLVKQVLAASHDQMIEFVESGSSAVLQVFLYAYHELSRQTGRTLFLMPDGEISSICSAASMIDRGGGTIKTIPLNQSGQLQKEVYEKMMTPHTALLSLSWANPLTGILHPIWDLAEICEKKGILFHVDVTYGIGKRELRIADLKNAVVTIDPTFMGSPYTSGIVIGPLSGIMQTDHLTSIVTASEAIEYRAEKVDYYCMEIARLRDLFEKEIQIRCKGAYPLFQKTDRLPETSVIVFDKVDAETMLYLLNLEGIYATCGGGKFPLLANLLTQYGFDRSVARSAVSFSFSFQTTEEEIEICLDKMMGIWEKAERFMCQ